MGGGALAGAAGAVGDAAKAAGSDVMNTAKNSLFGVEHPVQGAQQVVQGQAPPNATNNYQNSTIGRLFGAGQSSQETPAMRQRRMQMMQQ